MKRKSGRHPAVISAQRKPVHGHVIALADELKADVVIVGSRNPGIQTHLLGSEAANIAHIKMAGVFRQAIFFDQLGQFFLRGSNQMVFHLSGISSCKIPCPTFCRANSSCPCHSGILSGVNAWIYL
jgi:hypothetical protein